MTTNANTTTLRRLLTQPKPLAICRGKPSKSGRGNWPEFFGNSIQPWEEFNLKNLNDSYGHILDLEVPESRLSMGSPDQLLTAVDTARPDMMKWNYEMMRNTLGFAKERLNIHNGISLRHSYSAPDKSILAKIFPAGHPLTVDHMVSLDEYPLPNLVVGLGKLNSRFHARTLADHGGDATIENKLPLMQLANLCKAAQTRYGYILTEEDMLVCCFSEKIPMKKKDTMNVVMMPIPWSRHGQDQLTTDLALLWLSMLAMSAPESRKLVMEEEMIKIDQWEHKQLNEHHWVDRHRYSKFEKSANPPPPPPPPATGSSTQPSTAAGSNGGSSHQRAIFATGSYLNFDQDTGTSFGEFEYEAYINPSNDRI